MEIDSHPDRQDLGGDLLEHARAAGVRISIGSDAHAPGQLAAIELGLAAALEAGISADRILNFLSADQVVAWADGIVGSRGD